MIILRQKQYASCEDKETSKKKHLNKLGRETDKDIREAVKGTKAEKKVDKILNKSTKEMKEATQKSYSKQDREVVPADIAKKAKKEGVVQKRPDGKWGIISFKTNPATWWSSTYDTKESGEDALKAYWVNKRK